MIEIQFITKTMSDGEKLVFSKESSVLNETETEYQFQDGLWFASASELQK